MNDEKKWVFIHVPKTAGKTVSNVLGYEHSPTHHDLRGIDRYEDYFRFCFVRHPVDRFVSAYRYSVSMATRGSVNAHAVRDLILAEGLLDSVSDFIRVVRERDVNVLSSLHFKPQIEWVNQARPQFIGRFERLEDDVARICTVLGRDAGAELPRINRSTRKPSCGMNDDDRAWLRELYREDYRALGYGRPWQRDDALGG